jgi:hypothetical protein
MLRILANDSTRDKSVNLDERLAKKDALGKLNSYSSNTLILSYFFFI